MPITEDVKLGSDVRIFHPELVNLYGCVVGDETRIGAFVEIQAGAKSARVARYRRTASSARVSRSRTKCSLVMA